MLSIPVSNANYTNTVIKIKKAINLKKKIYICVAAAHLIMECQKNPKLLYGVKNASIITPDGMPLVWLSKLYGNNHATRVYGPNLTLITSKLAEEFDYKIFLLGGSPGQSEKLSKKLKNKFPKLKVVGFSDTPIRPIPDGDNDKIVNKINLAQPDVVFVGMGCPNQELWMIENRNKVSAPVLIGVGAAFDFITGKVKQAPLWMQKSGLEWLFRLYQEPKRLFKRYFMLNTHFVLKISKQIILDFINGKL